MNKPTLVAFALAAVLIGWAFWAVSEKTELNTATVAPTAVVVDGTQIIDITAKGGYSPREVVAKAGIPTVLRVATKNTFDCSASIVIPKLSYQKFLEPTAVTEINIPAEQAQGTLKGLCSMGMYNFQIKFQ